jgi:GxxExxY protein
MQQTKKYLDELTFELNGAAIEVHKNLGPGLMESVYHRCLKYELMTRNISYASELVVPVQYKDMDMDADLRCDLFIEKAIVVELKAIEYVLPLHEAILMTYMKLLKSPKGIMYNFHCANLIKGGQKTFVNDLYRALPDK